MKPELEMNAWDRFGNSAEVGVVSLGDMIKLTIEMTDTAGKFTSRIGYLFMDLDIIFGILFILSRFRRHGL